MPVDIPPDQARSVTVRVKLPPSAGVFTRSVGLTMEDDGMRQVNFRVTGRISKQPSDAAVARDGR